MLFLCCMQARCPVDSTSRSMMGWTLPPGRSSAQSLAPACSACTGTSPWRCTQVWSSSSHTCPHSDQPLPPPAQPPLHLPTQRLLGWIMQANNQLVSRDTSTILPAWVGDRTSSLVVDPMTPMSCVCVGAWVCVMKNIVHDTHPFTNTERPWTMWFSGDLNQDLNVMAISQRWKSLSGLVASVSLFECSDLLGPHLSTLCRKGTQFSLTNEI